MENYILIAILVLIIGAAAVYVIKSKKRGAKCIGCPSAKECAEKTSGCNGCSGGNGCDCSEK